MKSRQETYANKRRRPYEFEVEDHVYLRVSPMKGMKRFGVKVKLAPRYIGPFPILEKCGTVAYKLDLLPSLAGVHDIFHMSQLKKCLKAPMDVVFEKRKNNSGVKSWAGPLLQNRPGSVYMIASLLVSDRPCPLLRPCSSPIKGPVCGRHHTACLHCL
jgi:hypothetical protein